MISPSSSPGRIRTCTALSIYTQKDYDAITMGFQNVMFSYGADWGDPETYKVDGILNSEANAQALDLYKEFYKFVPPGIEQRFLPGKQQPLHQRPGGDGDELFRLLPGAGQHGNQPARRQHRLFRQPAGPDGARHAALGGQGISIVNYIDDERKQAAMDFLKWFGQNDVQLEWAALGGYTCNEEVLNSPEFLENTPYNQAFADSMKMVKDFWAVPVYGELLEVSQRELHNFVVVGEGTAQETLDKITEQHEAIFKEAGLLK